MVGLLHDDGKRYDSLTLVPWRAGHSVTWDVTVVDTLAASNVAHSASFAASTVDVAASNRCVKCSSLS